MRLFDVNHPVTGELFFGREKELKAFQKDFFDEIAKGHSVNYSLTGMNRIGKTSLVKEAFRRFKEKDNPDIYILETSLDGQKGFWRYWIFSILRPLLNQIGDSLEQVQEYRGYFNDRTVIEALIAGNDVEDMQAKENLELLFTALKQEGKSTLIVIDEFDKAEQVFGTREENFGWFRGLLQQDLGVSVVTISRRSIYYIEYNNFGGSTLHGIFSKHGLFGFSNSEIDEYFRRLESLYGPLSQEQKEDIWYYCGRSPFYLAVMGEKIINTPKGKAFKPEKISDNFIDSFNAIIRLLKEEKLLTAMLQMFVGPKYDMKAKDVGKLIDMGYCIKKETLDDREDGSEYDDYLEPENTSSYLTVCERFVDHLEEAHQAELEDIWPKMNKTENLLRKIVKMEFIKKYGDRWENKLEESYGSRQDTDGNKKKHEKIYKRANPDKQEEIGNSFLNVVSLITLKKIIRDNWDNMFNGYFRVSDEEFSKKMNILYNARNPIAHSNGELLTSSDIEEVDKICDEFISSIN